MAAGLEQSGEFAHGLLRILDMLQPFEACYIIKRAIAERQFRVEVAAVNVDTIKPENLRIKITTANIEAGIDQASGERPFTGGHVEQWPARKRFENTNYRIVNGFVGKRRSLARFTLKRCCRCCHWKKIVSFE